MSTSVKNALTDDFARAVFWPTAALVVVSTSLAVYIPIGLAVLAGLVASFFVGLALTPSIPDNEAESWCTTCGKGTEGKQTCAACELWWSQNPLEEPPNVR